MRATVAMKDFAVDQTTWQTVDSGKKSPIIWTQTSLNDLGAFDPQSPDRLTVPEGVRRVRLIASVGFVFREQGDGPLLQIFSLKNGEEERGYPGYLSQTAASGGYFNCSPTLNACGPILEVEAGDYFTLFAYQKGSSGVRIKSRYSTYFSMEAI